MTPGKSRRMSDIMRERDPQALRAWRMAFKM
jgi:hypothetical protein